MMEARWPISPRHWAVILCLVLLVVCAHGASAQKKVSAATSTLLDAAYRNDVESVRKALAAGANANTTHASATPLQIAAERGHAAVVELLLDRGANVNAIDALGDTSLAAAAANGHLAVVQSLLQRGAIVTTENREAESPLSLARKNRHEDVAKALVDAGANVRQRIIE